MWRKTEDSKPKSLRDTSPSPGPHAQRPGPPAPQYSPNTSAAVAQGLKIKGEISGHGDFFLDGEFEGKIRLAKGAFTVGPNGQVCAEIEAREVIILGQVIGTLKGCERVHIGSTGKLTGDMETRGVVVEEGAVLHSKVAVPQAAVPEVAEAEVSVREIDQPSQPSGPLPLPRAKGAAGAE